MISNNFSESSWISGTLAFLFKKTNHDQNNDIKSRFHHLEMTMGSSHRDSATENGLLLPKSSNIIATVDGKQGTPPSLKSNGNP